MRGLYGYVTLAVAALVLLFARSVGALEPDYVLGPEDSITVVVLRHSDLNVSAVIPSDGKIVVPILGEILASGKTRLQLAKQIAEGLRGRVADPEVSVMLQGMRTRRVYVLGTGTGQHIIDLKPGWRVTEVITAAGGLTSRPELTHARLFKPDGRVIRLDLDTILRVPQDSGNVPLDPGDVLSVESLVRGLAYLIGAVSSPGMCDLQDGWRVFELLAAAGGLTIAPQHAAARLLRRNGKILDLDLVKILSAPESPENVTIESGDVLAVLPSVLTGAYVIGRVGKPGFYQLGPGAGIAEAIRLAGGPQAGVELTKVQVYHADGTQETVDVQRAYVGDDPSLDKPLRGGDAVLVP
jgi:polysaccharide export outer membrane protein